MRGYCAQTAQESTCHVIHMASHGRTISLYGTRSSSSDKKGYVHCI